MDTFKTEIQKLSAKLSALETGAARQTYVQAQKPPYAPSGGASGAMKPGMYPKPPGANFSCFYCGVAGHGIGECAEMEKDRAAGKFTQQIPRGPIYVNNTLVRSRHLDGSTMKQRVDQAWAGGAAVNYQEEHTPYYDAYGQEWDDELVTHEVFHQTIAGMTNQILSAMGKETPAPAAPPPPEPTARDVLLAVQDLGKRVGAIEQYAINTRANQERDF
ncbi:hypothetical protein D9611_006051 [Ephemerocybe angulata]|uniref:CCHC-type domain-containing protein n=1 Tax=Ephemerocybe angulata TaxID=980116 RepID=A0A8H5CFW7_9AGAR|nr:hypothetical protein D9611_006051 [Tulosesus angulatus]